MKKPKNNLKTTPKKEYSLPRKIAVDVLGVLLIIAAGLFGWLPGPGGVPLLLAGLGLLATNHEWARKLLLGVKENGIKIMDTIFNDRPVVAFAFDAAALALLVGAGIFFGNASGNVVRGIATAMVFFGIGLFLGNRKRIYAINRFVQRVIGRKT